MSKNNKVFKLDIKKAVKDYEHEEHELISYASFCPSYKWKIGYIKSHNKLALGVFSSGSFYYKRGRYVDKESVVVICDVELKF